MQDTRAHDSPTTSIRKPRDLIQNLVDRHLDVADLLCDAAYVVGSFRQSSDVVFDDCETTCHILIGSDACFTDPGWVAFCAYGGEMARVPIQSGRQCLKSAPAAAPLNHVVL